MNPYASESNNRFAVRTKPKEPKAPSEDDGKIDHPLFEGKKIDMSKQELKAFTKAMEHEEFKTILNDYVKEISDPKNKEEYELYLRQLEEQGDLPVGTKLIQPIGCFCIKTTAKKMTSDINKQYFDQKTFINVAMHEHIQKPQRTYVTMPNGQSGYSWQLPYTVSKPRHDQDKTGNLCSTYDVVFHRDIGDFITHPDFKKFVSDTAIDGVNRVLAEHKEKVSSDYKILKNLKCKGGEPGLMTVKAAVENPLLQNADVNKHETKLQKEVTTQADEHKKSQSQPTLDSQGQPLPEIDEEQEDKEEEEPMPKSVMQPKYKVVYSYPVELQDSWEGPATAELLERNPQLKIPKELTITINVNHVESMKMAKLDINDTNMIFEYPNLYYLDLNLKYICNSAKGSAKFDKAKKTLTIRVPVTGLTEDSQKVFDENFREYQKWLERRSEQQPLVAEVPALPTDQLMQGEAKTILDMDGAPSASIPDPYKLVNDAEDLGKLKEEALREEVQLNEREAFLKVYKEDRTSLNPDAADGEGEEGQREIKFKPSLADNDDDSSSIKLTGLNPTGSKPLIQELTSTSTLNTSTTTAATDAVKASTAEEIYFKPFDWEAAERLDAKVQFLHQKDYVFINMAMKGYSKLSDVHYALSENELMLEVREPGTQRVHRVGKTLFRGVDVDQSSVELLVDFIAVKLKKLDKDVSWDMLGYDINTFTMPMRGQMKSNYLTYLKPKEPKQEIVNEKDGQENKENENSENVDEAARAQEEEVERQKAMQREEERLKARQSALCYMSLESSIIYKIY